MLSMPGSIDVRMTEASSLIGLASSTAFAGEKRFASSFEMKVSEMVSL